MTIKEKEIVEQAENIVKKFNKMYPVGSIVMHRDNNINGVNFIEKKVKSKAFISERFGPCVYFEGTIISSIEEGYVFYNN